MNHTRRVAHLGAPLLISSRPSRAVLGVFASSALALALSLSGCGPSEPADGGARDAAAGADGSAGGSGGGGAGGATGGAGGSGGAGAGCGATTWPQPASGQTNATYTINVDGTTREYVVGLPSSYSSGQHYPVVFAWHGLGGTAAQIASGGNRAGEVYTGYYGQRYRSNQAQKPIIFVAGQGLPNTAGGTDYAWPNTNGRDVAFVRAVLAWLQANYCIDEARIFSVGMSYGGIMSNTLGCAMGDVFRAIAPMSGAGPGGFVGGLGRDPTCVGQVAAWIAHGSTDTTVNLTSGQASRDFWLARNHCQPTTVPTSPSPCVSYQGCDTGHPVTWCEFPGGHVIESWEVEGIWAFLLQFL